MAKNLPAMQWTGILSLGRKEPLEEGVATHSIILAWRIPRTKEPGGLLSRGDSQTNLLTPGCDEGNWCFLQGAQCGARQGEQRVLSQKTQSL